MQDCLQKGSSCLVKAQAAVGAMLYLPRGRGTSQETRSHRQKHTQADLHVKHTITLAEALLGFDHTLTHLDGRAVRLRKPGVVQYSDVDRIPGEGMPMSENNPKAKGDLHVEYIVRLPNELSGLSQSDKDFIHKRFA